MMIYVGELMTLVLALADKKTVHLSCDFRLTDSVSRLVIPGDAHKLVTVMRKGFSAVIGVTGLGFIGGRPVGDWIASAVSNIGQGGALTDLLDELTLASADIRAVSVSGRCHTFLVGAIDGSQVKIALVSNFESFLGGEIKRGSYVKDSLTLSTFAPKKPMVMVTGDLRAVVDHDRRRLLAALRSGSTVDEIQERLRQVNVAAHVRTTSISRPSSISEGCYVASLDVSGTSSSRTFLTENQTSDIMPPQISEMLRSAGLRLVPQLDEQGKPKPIQFKGATGIHYTPSVEYFRKQIKEQPGNAELWNNYGAWLADRMRYAEAVDAYVKSLEIDPNHVTALANLAHQTWTFLGDFQEAEKLFERALQGPISGQPSWIVSNFAIYLGEGKGDHERAIKLHNQAAKDTGNPVYLARKADFIARHKIVGEDPRLLVDEALKKGDNNAELQFLAGNVAFAFGDFQIARDRYCIAASLNSDNAFYLSAYGEMLCRTGEGESALYCFRRAIRKGFTASRLYASYGWALLLAQKFTQAFRCLSKACELPAAELANVINLSFCLYALGRPEEARDRLLEISIADVEKEVKLEALAVLLLCSYPSLNQVYLSDLLKLVELGVRVNAGCVRAVCSRNADSSVRKLGDTLADFIEGKSMPSSLDEWQRTRKK